MAESGFKNIIIRMPNWIGDAVMATPLIDAIKSHWPEAKVTLLCQGAAISSLFDDPFPHVDEMVTFERSEKRGSSKLAMQLRQGRYDLGILLTNSFSSAWLFWRGGVKNRIGFASDFRSPFLTQSISLPKIKGREHQVITYKRLLQPLGIPISETKPKLFVSQSEQEGAQKILETYGIERESTVIGINPGAAFGSAKCWLPERFREVIGRLAKRPKTYILCFADRAGADLVNGICHNMPSNIINLAAKTSLRELMALMVHCHVFLSNDSGPMHIAAALNCPLVALFGSTNEIATGPYKHGTVIHKHVSCSPCYRRQCPIDFRCMKQIESDEVYHALLNYL